MRIVAVLSAINGNVDSLTDTLRSLMQQSHKLDDIYLFSRHDVNIPPNIRDHHQLIIIQESIKSVRSHIMTLETDPDTYILSAEVSSVYPPDLVKNLLQKLQDEPGITFESHQPQYQYMVYQRSDLNINLNSDMITPNLDLNENLDYSDAEVNIITVTSLILVVLFVLLAFFIWPIWIPL